MGEPEPGTAATGGPPPATSGGRMPTATGGPTSIRAGGPAPAVARGGTLARRVVLATCLVALVSVLATALVSVPLASRTATRQAAQALAAEASLVAVVLRSPDIRPVAADRLAPQLARQRIQLWLIRDGAPDR